jgi:subtilisin-like proprotein convertase family protein
MLIPLAWLLMSGSMAFGQGIFNFQVNQAIPDADPNGVALSGNVSGLAGTISGVTVSLNLTNGYNGDFYAYLTGPNGGYAVLLNRVGVSNNVTATGYANPGLDVTFVSGGGDIHYYQSLNPVYNSGGQLTGNWAPDGRNLDPTSSPSLFGSTAPSATLSSFTGTNPNGLWVLFVADFSNGGLGSVSTWGLNITTTSVPEPSTVPLLVAGGAFMAWFAHRRRIKAGPPLP